jgi:histidine ammonia-lyase
MSVTLQEFSDILFSKKKFQITKLQNSVCKKSEAFLLSEISKGRIIYGINTGFGPLANIRIPDKKIPELQKNLIYHLATGVGSPYSPTQARSIFLARIICLSQGYSGISLENLQKIIKIFNLKLTPYIPSLGTVGASGDLTPLSHLALAFLGEGYFLVNEKKNTCKEHFYEI